MQTEPMQQCDHCLKHFPQSKIATHFGYCRRNIKKCQVCGQMYDINFKEQHQQQFHKKSPVKQQPKTKFCQYCQLNVPINQFQGHFKACQSRTKPCNKCNKPIMNKDYICHIISCPGVIEEPKRPNNYNDYINQVQKKQEIPTNNNSNRIISKQRQKSREPIFPQRKVIQKPRQQKNYAQIIRPQQKVEIKRLEPKVTVHYPQRQEKRQIKGPSYQVKVEEKKQIRGNYYQKQQPRRQQNVIRREEIKPIRQQYGYKKQQIPIKRYSGVVNAPTNNMQQYKPQQYKPQQYKPEYKQQYKQQQRLPPQPNIKPSLPQKQPQPPKNYINPPKIITSTKQISSNINPIKPNIKESKSIQRVIYNKRQQQNKIRYANQNINPKRQDQPYRNNHQSQNNKRVEEKKAPTVVVKNQQYKYQPVRQRQPQRKAQQRSNQNQQRANQYDYNNQYYDYDDSYDNHNTHNNNYNHNNNNYAFQLSAQQQQLQQIILQSMGQQNKKNNVGRHSNTNNNGNRNNNKNHISNDIPFLQGEDIMNQSFIEKQRAIQEQFFKKARR